MTKKATKENPFESKKPIYKDFFDIPLLGIVRASHPYTAYGDYQLAELINNYKNNNADTVGLQVTDDAMHKIGIIKNDYLSVNLKVPLNNGDIAVVKLGERVFIRKFFKHDRMIRLETANDYPTQIIIDPKAPGFEIIGKVVSISREL